MGLTKSSAVFVGLLSAFVYASVYHTALALKIAAVVFSAVAMAVGYSLWYLRGSWLSNRSVDDTVLPRKEFDDRRGASYPSPITNTWYCLAYSNEVKVGEVQHIRAIGQSFAVWRTSDGKPVVQSAFCPHMGANLAVGGTVEGDCLKCPFHAWEFDKDGCVTKIPNAKDPSCKPSQARSLQTFRSEDWCGMLMVWFQADADDEVMRFELPAHIPHQLRAEAWEELTQLQIGSLPLSPVDWVDQSSDHAHFNLLHSEMLVPWTSKPLPRCAARGVFCLFVVVCFVCVCECFVCVCERQRQF
jgi:nitrite reductase/ring-hydroxylating ferredoxin subunit